MYKMVTRNNIGILKNKFNMKNILRFFVATLCVISLVNTVLAEEVHVGGGTKSSNDTKQIAVGCEPGSNFKYLDINNVRTIIYSYGNGWFIENAEYEIPKGSRKTSMFSFSLWIGGIDINNNLKLAAYRFGQGPTNSTAHTRNDFWPGPLTVDGTAAVDAETCAKWDKLYPMTRAEVLELQAWQANKAAYPNYQIPKSILEWPTHGDRSKGQAWYMAPYYDADGSGDYDPKKGDYPYYDFGNKLCPTNLKPGEKVQRAPLRNGEPGDTLGILVDQVLKGDQTLWNVYNDKGNFHSETQGEPIGMEIRAQYFAFATNDEINNMTFYSYELVNRSTYILTGTYFCQWVDPDLGYAYDDYVGCDVKRGLGYCYNGTPIDGTGQPYAYGAHPPAVGVDFFQGPYIDPDGRDNPKFTGDCSILTSEYPNDQFAINGADAGYGDGIIDNERFGMRRFVYHTNGGPSYGNDPAYAPQYYLFLRGIWSDNTRMLYGGIAHSPTSYGPACDFMFPGDTDPCDWGTGGQPPNGPKYWTEETAGNNPADRRFMQSAGPFTLNPGACNYITVGIPWARTISGTPFESVSLLRIVDDKCQNLFDNCFAVLSGPNAPDLTIEEMDKQLIIYISNRKMNDKGNNYHEQYSEWDPNIPNPDSLPHNNRHDSLYRFEGYQIFQVKDATVSAADLYDATKSRLVAQCDIQNGVGKLINWTLDANLGGNVGQVMVEGADKGIKHSFVITEDKFATGDSRLVNHKQYYYIAVAYGYNEWKKFNPQLITGIDAIDGQKIPYLRGRGNYPRPYPYTAIPHIPTGTIVNSEYGEGPVITRIQGQGNGGMTIELSPESIAKILSKPPADSINNKYGDPDYPIDYTPTYLVSQGPLKVTVIDPLNVVNGKYEVKFDSMAPLDPKLVNPFLNPNIKFGKWTLTDKNTGKSYRSDTTTVYPYEQLFLDLGLALTINQIPFPGDTLRNGSVTVENGLLFAPSAIYEDSTKVWLSGIPDDDIPASFYNWIRSGTYRGGIDQRYYDWDMAIYRAWDPNKNYQTIQMQNVGFGLGGTWAPYALTAYNDQNLMGPAINSYSKKKATIANLASVDVVMTPDRTKWTRCVVVEMCWDTNLAQGHAKQYYLRNAPSVNADGVPGVTGPDPLSNSNYISETSMGWFPGYAINLETGERLNIMFSENSWLVADNGRDMVWNPSSRVTDAVGVPVFGGQHYVYIMGSTIIDRGDRIFTFPAYDAGAYLRSTLLNTSDNPNLDWATFVYASCLYTAIPTSVPGKESEWLSNDVTIKIKIAKPYQRYFSLPMPGYNPDSANNNNYWPVYEFNTSSIATGTNSQEQATTDLDLINVVPNPYYAYDDYENNRLDNRIKIVNLPSRCTVTIFDLSGTLIRQYVVDKTGIPEPRSSTAGKNTDAKTSIDWDLKNFAGIPISGGVYLIHVKADNLGERTLKWFGILRPVDMNSL